MAEAPGAVLTPGRSFSLAGTLARWFDGLSVRGIAFIVLLCFVNAFRRGIQDLGNRDLLLATWSLALLKNTGYGLLIAMPVALGVVAVYNLIPRPLWLRSVAFIAAVLLLCVIGVYIQSWTELGCTTLIDRCRGAGFLSNVANGLMRYGALCGLFTVVFVYLRTANENARRAQDAEHERARFAQRMEEARLRMLQAQIEPHFLFNTLANVRRLYQTSAADAVRMLDNLMRYFAVALPEMRGNESTLGREAELTASYLEMQGIRMGRRLQFEIDIPHELAAARLPPMMVLTLAENAVKHGLAPLPEGGSVRITAAVHGSELQLRVADTGRGFTQTSGGGTGLANIRARLSAMYGSQGRFTLVMNEPRGVVATIAVPLAATKA
jgi:sensor histidine kinase YesM